MNKRVCFLRGVNVGGRHLLPMQDLGDILQRLGCTDIATYIQSGNVVFRHDESDAGKLETLIGQGVQSRFGFKPRVLVMSVEDFEAAVAANPYMDAKTVHVCFLSARPAAPDLRTLGTHKSPREEFALIDKVFYLHAPDGIGRSKLAANIEKLLGVPATSRNWRTAQKVLQMARSLDAQERPRRHEPAVRD